VLLLFVVFYTLNRLCVIVFVLVYRLFVFAVVMLREHIDEDEDKASPESYRTSDNFSQCLSVVAALAHKHKLLTSEGKSAMCHVPREHLTKHDVLLSHLANDTIDMYNPKDKNAMSVNSMIVRIGAAPGNPIYAEFEKEWNDYNILIHKYNHKQIRDVEPIDPGRYKRDRESWTFDYLFDAERNPYWKRVHTSERKASSFPLLAVDLKPTPTDPFPWGREDRTYYQHISAAVAVAAATKHETGDVAWEMFEAFLKQWNTMQLNTVVFCVFKHVYANIVTPALDHCATGVERADIVLKARWPVILEDDAKHGVPDRYTKHDTTMEDGREPKKWLMSSVTRVIEGMLTALVPEATLTMVETSLASIKDSVTGRITAATAELGDVAKQDELKRCYATNMMVIVSNALHHECEYLLNATTIDKDILRVPRLVAITKPLRVFYTRVQAINLSMKDIHAKAADDFSKNHVEWERIYNALVSSATDFDCVAYQAEVFNIVSRMIVTAKEQVSRIPNDKDKKVAESKAIDVIRDVLSTRLKNTNPTNIKSPALDGLAKRRYALYREVDEQLQTKRTLFNDYVHEMKECHAKATSVCAEAMRKMTDEMKTWTELMNTAYNKSNWLPIVIRTKQIENFRVLYHNLRHQLTVFPCTLAFPQVVVWNNAVKFLNSNTDAIPDSVAGGLRLIPFLERMAPIAQLGHAYDACWSWAWTTK
jgi:hypothetical protein